MINVIDQNLILLNLPIFEIDDWKVNFNLSLL